MSYLPVCVSPALDIPKQVPWQKLLNFLVETFFAIFASMIKVIVKSILRNLHNKHPIS